MRKVFISAAILVVIGTVADVAEGESLGVLIQQVTPQIAQSVGLVRPRGAFVADVSKGGPADRAGIKAGDVVLEYDGKTVEQADNLPPLVASTAVGTKMEVRVFRENREIVLFVTAGAGPATDPQAETEPSIILGVDGSTGTRFWTRATQREVEFRRGPFAAPEYVLDKTNPCPWFRDYLVIGEVPVHILLSDGQISKRLVEKGKEFAQRGCPDFKVTWNMALKVNLYVERYEKDKQPAVTAEWKRDMGKEEISMEYRNRALEDKKGRRVEGDFVKFWVDKSTGTQFGVSQTYPHLIEHEPCLFNMSTKSLVGIVPNRQVTRHR